MRNAVNACISKLTPNPESLNLSKQSKQNLVPCCTRCAYPRRCLHENLNLSKQSKKSKNLKGGVTCDVFYSPSSNVSDLVSFKMHSLRTKGQLQPTPITLSALEAAPTSAPVLPTSFRPEIRQRARFGLDEPTSRPAANEPAAAVTLVCAE